MIVINFNNIPNSAHWTQKWQVCFHFQDSYDFMLFFKRNIFCHDIDIRWKINHWQHHRWNCILLVTGQWLIHMVGGVGLWCQTQLSTICQLCRNGLFYWWRKPASSHWPTLSHNIVSCAPRHEQDSNTSHD